MSPGEAASGGKAVRTPVQAEAPGALPAAEQELARVTTQPAASDLDPEQQDRVNEAAVRLAEIAAEQAENDRKLRETIANRIFRAVWIQVAIADTVFVLYGFWRGWDIKPGTMNAWLGATVIQVLAVALVIARSLFPDRTKGRKNGDANWGPTLL